MLQSILYAVDGILDTVSSFVVSILFFLFG